MKKFALLCLLLLITTIIVAQTDNAVITSQNATSVMQLAQFGDGVVDITSDLIYAPTADTFALSTSLGVWVYDAMNPNAEPFLLDGHTAKLYEIAYSPDGQFLASAGYDGLVQIWHIPTRSIIQTFSDDWLIDAMQFAPDGQAVFMTELNGGLIYRASIETGQVQRYDFGDVEIDAFALHPSDNTVALFFDQPTPQLSLWELDGTIHRPITSFPFPTDATAKWQIAFSADGSRLIGGANQGASAIWDVTTAELITIYEEDDDARIAQIIPSPDGASFLTRNSSEVGSDNEVIRIKKWSLEGELLDTFELGRNWDKVDAVYTADTIRMITADSFNNRMSGWDWSTGEEIAYQAKNWLTIADMALSPDGETIAISNYKEVLFLSADTLIEKSRMEIAGGVYHIAYAPNGETFATYNEKGIKLWDVETGEVFPQERPSSDSMIFSPNGQSIIVTTYSDTVTIWDAQADELDTILDVKGYVTGLLFSDNGELVISLVRSGMVKLYFGQHLDIITNAFIQNDEVGDMIWLESSLITLSEEQGILAWDRTTNINRILVNTPLDDRLAELDIIAYHPNEDLLVAGNFYGQIILLDPQNPDSAWLHTLIGHRSFLHNMLFSPDGTRLYSASNDGTVRVWGVPQSS